MTIRSYYRQCADQSPAPATDGLAAPLPERDSTGALDLKVLPMPLVQVTLRSGRGDEQIRRLAEEITNAVARTLDAPAASVRVLVHELPAGRWFVAGAPLDQPVVSKPARRVDDQGH